MPRARGLIWLLPIAGAMLAVRVYRDAYATEEATRAGAEPVLTGLWVAGPLVLLFLLQVLCALGVYMSTSARGRAACTAGVLASAGVGLVGTIVIMSA